MIKVFVSPSLVEVESLQDILEQSGIPCIVKNKFSTYLAGAVPFVEIFPEIWVLHDEDVPKAKDILAYWAQGAPEKGPPWTCSDCGELHSQEFASCWQCGRERP